jgi:hypothetical protein
VGGSIDGVGGGGEAGVKIGIDCHTVGGGIAANETDIMNLVCAPAPIDTKTGYRLTVTKRSPEVDELAVGRDSSVIRLVPNAPVIPRRR